MIKKISIISVIVLLIDQFLKYVISKFSINKVVIPNFFKLSYTKNYGVAFSMFNNKSILILLISIILIFLLLVIMYKDYIIKNNNSRIKNITYGILFGGIFGNLIDRIIRGYVIDYISLTFFGFSFAIFNLADICITIGAILLSFNSFKK